MLKTKIDLLRVDDRKILLVYGAKLKLYLSTLLAFKAIEYLHDAGRVHWWGSLESLSTGYT